MLVNTLLKSGAKTLKIGIFIPFLGVKWGRKCVRCRALFCAMLETRERTELCNSSKYVHVVKQFRKKVKCSTKKRINLLTETQYYGIIGALMQKMKKIMGYSQAVRHQTLTLAFVGPNPATPAKNLLGRSSGRFLPFHSSLFTKSVRGDFWQGYR